MPPKKSNEPVKEAAECILRIGKNNNVVQWKEEMQTTVTALYGLTGMFFTTNKRYQFPRVSYEDYSSESESSESEDEEVDPDAPALSPEEIAILAAEKAARATARGARNGRRRRIAEKARVRVMATCLRA